MLLGFLNFTLECYPTGFCFLFCFFLLYPFCFVLFLSMSFLMHFSFCSCLTYTLHHYSAQFPTWCPNILESMTRIFTLPASLTMPWETTLRSSHMSLTLGGPSSRLKGCQREQLAQKRHNKTIRGWMANCSANI